MMRTSGVFCGVGSKLLVLVVACGLACEDAKQVEQGKDVPQGSARPSGGPKEVVSDGLPAAEALLDEAVVAMGGDAKFKALAGYYVESSLDMGTLGLKGVSRGWWGRAGYYNETEMPGIGQMKIGGTAAKVWREDPVNGLRVLSGKEEEQARWSATLCLVPEWREFFKSAKTLAVKAGAAEIELLSPLGDKVVLRIDVDSKLPVSQTFTQASPLGDTPTTVTFEDWREVEGLKVSFRQVVDASLMKAVSVTTKLELNPQLNPAQFEMPGGAEAVTPGAPVAPPVVLDTKGATGKKVAGKKQEKAG